MARSNIPVVQTDGLTKVFRDFWRRAKVEAVRNLNLEIRPGEVFGLLGPNGSGKSTTIKMLLGLLFPTSGRISLFGRSPTDVSIKSRIGFLPEESYLYRFLDARETLDYYGRLFHLPSSIRRERTEKLLEMVGLKHEARRRLGEYSKGMARRIGLAQALINDPDFLILDEPTTGLDPIGTRQIKDLIRELGDRGKTILLSSHLLGDVEDVCDRVAILYGGQLRAAGEVGSLLKQEDKTEIVTDRLSEEDLKQIRKIVEKDHASASFSVRSPSERLESLFLRIVEEAQVENVETSGARGAGAMADFLGQDEGEAVIQRLLENTDVVEQVSEDSQVEETEGSEASEAVLSSLLQDQAEESVSQAAEDSAPSTETPVSPVQQAAIPEETDRNVIDSLLGSDEDDSDDQEQEKHS